MTTTFPLAPAQVEEGKLVRVTAQVTDDVQVRNVEFYLDGVKVQTDGSFPFEHRFVTPLVTATRTSFRLRAKAIDTGGNETWSDDIHVALNKDVTPPQVADHIPADAAVVAVTASIAAFFSEPVNVAAISMLTFKLQEAGADGTFDTADDVTLVPAGFEYRPATFGAFMNFTNALSPGHYHATVSPGIFDLKGNQLAAATVWSFQVIGASMGQTTPAKIAAGSGDTFALKSDGTLWACGLDQLSELGFVENHGCN